MNAQAHSITATTVDDRPAFVLHSPDGRCAATVVPGLAMLCWSLTLDGEEYLGQPNSVSTFAEDWATTGIPLLHPWANRLGGDQIVGVGAPTVATRSPLVPTDENGLAIHGLNLAGAGWKVEEALASEEYARVTARLAFVDAERLAIFPFAHELTVTMSLAGHSLRIATSVTNRADRPMPVSFGWHPYFRLPRVPRSQWRVSLPVATQAELDRRMLPTGSEGAVSIPPAPLGDRTFDDLFPSLLEPRIFTLWGGGREVAVVFDHGYPVAQVYAPSLRDLIAFEPMTAPTNALVTGAVCATWRPGKPSMRSSR